MSSGVDGVGKIRTEGLLSWPYMINRGRRGPNALQTISQPWRDD